MKNLALIVVAVLFVILLTLFIDRLLPLFHKMPEEHLSLIFPRNSSQSCKTSEFEYTVKINSIGIRGPDVSLEKTDKYRIAVFGSSYVYGWGVEYPDTWVAKLEANLNAQGKKVEVLNLGKPGDGVAQYADIAKKAIPLLKPDMVILALGQGFDMGAGPRPPKKLKERVLDVALVLYPNVMKMIRAPQIAQQNLAEGNVSTAEMNYQASVEGAKNLYGKFTPELIAKFEKLDPKVRDAFFAGDVNGFLIDLALRGPTCYVGPLDLNSPYNQSMIQGLANYMREIKSLAEKYNGRMIVVSVPYGAYVNKPANKNYQRIGFEATDAMLTTDAPDQEFGKACQLAGLPFCTATEAFRAQADNPKLFYELDLHPSPAGHALFADTITPCVAANIGK